MPDHRPFMLLRARAKDSVRAEFGRWFEDTHLRDVAKIPGIVRVRKGTTEDGTRLALYSFADAEAVQPALASPEAAYARGTWEHWQPHLEELLIELWSATFTIPLYRNAN
jgi:hypothetical protein